MLLLHCIMVLGDSLFIFHVIVKRGLFYYLYLILKRIQLIKDDAQHIAFYC